MTPSTFLRPALLAAAALLAAGPASAQFAPRPDTPPPPPHQPLPTGVRAEYVPLSGGEPGVLYEPISPGPKSHIGVFVMHASGDYLTFSACTELSKRGYRVLCANNSTSKSGAFDDGVFDTVLMQAKLGVGYLRHYPGVDKVVLFGHSGGATIMTAYQMIAEGGVASCQGAERIHRCPDSFAGFPKADGVVLADANWGQAEMTLLSVDPSVIDDGNGMRLNSALDMYDPANGYGPAGSHYAAPFRRAFLAAEGARNNALVKKAEDRLALIDAGRGDYGDDEPFIIAGASFIGNRLFSEDPSLLHHSRKPHLLLHGDGTTTTEIITSVRKAEGRQNPTHRYAVGALKTTVRNYLSSYAIRVTPDFGYDASGLHGVEWTSTYASPPGDVERIAAPFLALGMTGHWEGLAAEEIYDHAASRDRTVAFVEGATHVYTPCDKCEKPASAYGDTIKTTYDFIDGWMSKPGRLLTAQAK